MGQSVLVFISHSSDDKETFIESLVNDLEDAYINVWIDKRKIVPGDNLRKSIFRDGLDKADIALIFFTQKSLKSSWVDREIKHVLREESTKGNNFDLNKIISIFDSQKTYDKITERYPELTENLLHLMPTDYTKTQFGQLVSAIWSKYLSLQGGDIEIQRQLLAKDKEIFQKDKEIQSLKETLKAQKNESLKNQQETEFEQIYKSGKINRFINNRTTILSQSLAEPKELSEVTEARAFGLIEPYDKNRSYVAITERGLEFFKWYFLNEEKL